jgi:hypothetical protein
VHGFDEMPADSINYMYKLSTGYTNLRNHPIKHHEAYYTDLCAKEGWSYATKKDKKPTVGDNRKMALPAFTPDTFLEYLVRFVTADDQVSVGP